eukprot:XP_015143265.1 uncharacterized protein LOC107053548 [Gallus gallus]
MAGSALPLPLLLPGSGGGKERWRRPPRWRRLRGCGGGSSAPPAPGLGRNGVVSAAGGGGVRGRAGARCGAHPASSLLSPRPRPAAVAASSPASPLLLLPALSFLSLRAAAAFPAPPRRFPSRPCAASVAHPGPHWAAFQCRARPRPRMRRVLRPVTVRRGGRGRSARPAPPAAASPRPGAAVPLKYRSGARPGAAGAPSRAGPGGDGAFPPDSGMPPGGKPGVHRCLKSPLGGTGADPVAAELCWRSWERVQADTRTALSFSLSGSNDSNGLFNRQEGSVHRESGGFRVAFCGSVSQRQKNLVDMPDICRAGDGPDMRQPFPLIPFASVS